MEGLIGFAGVIIGVMLTGLKDWIASSVSSKRDQRYLATRVICLLEIFVDKCARVIRDDGTYLGQPDEDGYYRPKVQAPDFDPLALDVNWLSIDSGLMHKILYLPNEVYLTDSRLANFWEYVASPPEYTDFFEERAYLYSKLAITASEIIHNLYKTSGIKEEKEGLRWFEPDEFEKIVKSRA